MEHVLQVLEALWMEEFTLRGKSYKFDSNGDINQGYDVIMWSQNESHIHVHDVVAEYHLHNNSFTHTDHSSTRTFKGLQVGPPSAGCRKTTMIIE